MYCNKSYVNVIFHSEYLIVLRHSKRLKTTCNNKMEQLWQYSKQSYVNVVSLKVSYLYCTHLFLDYGWPLITETVESETSDKGVLLYLLNRVMRVQWSNLCVVLKTGPDSFKCTFIDRITRLSWEEWLFESWLLARLPAFFVCLCC